MEYRRFYLYFFAVTFFLWEYGYVLLTKYQPKKETAALEKQVEAGKKVSISKQLEDNRLLIDLDNLRRFVDALPEEIKKQVQPQKKSSTYQIGTVLTKQIRRINITVRSRHRRCKTEHNPEIQLWKRNI